MKTLDSSTVQQMLLNKFPLADVFLSDKDYATTTKEWLTGPFYNNYNAWLVQHGLDSWSNVGDCDAFSSSYMVFAQFCHTISAKKLNKAPEGIAIGELWYVRKNQTGHAINVAICGDDVINIEPQNGRIVNLQEIECNSCYFIRM